MTSSTTPNAPNPADESRIRAAREAISRIHLQDPPCEVNPQVCAVTTEEIAGHSPDGRPADQPSRNWGRIALAVVLFGVLPTILVLVVIFGGADALLLGLVYAGVVAFAAFPVWYAGLMRRREEQEATDIVQHSLAEHGQGTR